MQKLFKFILKLLCVPVFLFALELSAKPLTPNKTQAKALNVHMISAQEAKMLFDQGALFFDVRKPVEVSRLKIKGAKRAYYNEKGGNAQRKVDWDNAKDAFDISALPEDKTKEIVFYCNGKRCWKSFKAVITATAAGYSNVFWFREGIPQWEKLGYPTE
jgi:rhodanese-related sulfurtransferase